MNTEKLFLVDPYNVEHIRLIKKFEEENEMETSIIDSLFKDTSNETKEEYEKNNKESNEINISLFLEDSSTIKDMCIIQGVKDRKSCNITFSKLKTKQKSRKLITLSTDFALNTLGMQEAFISVSASDKNMLNYLSSKGFESLGEENGKVIYLKEKEEIELHQRHY